MGQRMTSQEKVDEALSMCDNFEGPYLEKVAAFRRCDQRYAEGHKFPLGCMRTARNVVVDVFECHTGRKLRQHEMSMIQRELCEEYTERKGKWEE